jgi:23S rRNA pseudouridine1911/1915/1917 synthase
MKIIKPAKNHLRLDKYLSQELGLPRARIQKLIKQGSIAINGKSASPHKDVKKEDTIKIETTEITSLVRQGALTPPKISKIKIIAETTDYIIIDKPAGIAVHGAEHMKDNTLADFIAERYPEIIRVGPDPDRPGIVHRIDKMVSGAMVVARTEEAYACLASQFKKRMVKKIYTALVHEPLDKSEGSIDFPIARSNSGFKMAARPHSQEGKKALTEYEVIKNYFHYSLVSVVIKTGRTHQIRAHFAAIGHPVAGDELYGAKKFRDKNKKLGLDRIFLHSRELGFKELDGKFVNFKIGLPDELKNILKKIK